MILFHSEYCNHCKMLMRSIQAAGGPGTEIKLASIEQIRASGRKLPPQLHSVPALMFPADRNMIFGKTVFDYLFLPGRGLFAGGAPAASAPAAATPAEPEAFSLAGLNSISESYTMITEDTHGAHAPDNQVSMDNRASAWVSINDPATLGASTNASAFQEETRTKKNTIDLDAYRAERAKDLQLPDIKKTNVPPPIHTR